MLTFEPGTTIGDGVCVSITVIEDQIAEGNERISLTLSTTSSLVDFGTDNATVVIVDNDGKIV